MKCFYVLQRGPGMQGWHDRRPSSRKRLARDEAVGDGDGARMGIVSRPMLALIISLTVFVSASPRSRARRRRDENELKRFYECHKHGVQVGEHCPMCVVHAYLPTPSQYTVPRAVAVGVAEGVGVFDQDTLR